MYVAAAKGFQVPIKITRKDSSNLLVQPPTQAQAQLVVFLQIRTYVGMNIPCFINHYSDVLTVC